MSNTVFKLVRGKVPLFYAWYEVMHTRLDLVLCDLPEEMAQSVCSDLIDEVQRLEKRLNRFDPDSDLSYLNKNGYNHSVQLDSELWEILTHCLSLQAQTNGFFDITLGAGRVADPENSLPPLQMDDASKSVRFASPEITLDLSGYAKGLALEHLKKSLWIKGIENGLINFGNSSVYAVGSMPYAETKGWHVGVDNVYAFNTSALDLTLHDAALSISGNTGRSTPHILNPQTGTLIETDGSIAIVSASPLECEALSTALYAAQTEEIQREILSRFSVLSVHSIAYEDKQATPVVTQLA